MYPEPQEYLPEAPGPETTQAGFAPAKREDEHTLGVQRRRVLTSASAQGLDAVPLVFMILNSCRQLVHANQALLDALEVGDISTLLGKRPGELFDCIYIEEDSGGCGTSEFCATCGGIEAILESLAGKRSVRECRMLRKAEGGVEALDLRVTATPLELDGEAFTTYVVLDVSHETRRRALERIFFHDILNKAGGLHGILQILTERCEGELQRDLDFVALHCQGLIDEILAQRELAQAENMELVPRYEVLSTAEVLKTAVRSYSAQQASDGKSISIDAPEPDLAFISDSVLLGRVLGNMLKNALEATPRQGEVRIGARGQGEFLRFTVSNPGTIEQDVQKQVFKRSFSTKGEGRGLGTFSIKLLTERYLNGEVGFSSDEATGTEFWILVALEQGGAQ